MWIYFLFDMVVAALFLYLPGFLLLSFSWFSKWERIALAPLVSSATYYLLAYCYGFFCVESSWLSIVVPSAILGLALFCVVRAGYMPAPARGRALSSFSPRVKEIVFFFGIVVAVVGIFFVRTLDSAGSFYQENDNIFHLTVVRDFLNSGEYRMSSLVSYPASWHVVVALVASVLGGAEVAIAANAVNCVLLVLVYPLSMMLFLSRIFGDRPVLVALGGVCVAGFAAFPWGFLLFGPLYPNLLSYAMLPASMAVFIDFVTLGGVKDKVVCFGFFALSCVPLVFAHPNALFVGIVILSPFCVSSILGMDGEGRFKKGLFAALFVFAVFAIWAFLFCAPAFSGVVDFEWPAYLSIFQSLVNDALVSYTKASAPQVLMGFAVFLGILYSLFRPRYRWLACSYFILLVMHVVNASSDGFLKHFLTGFWYSDEFRVAAALAMAGVPLAVMGLYAMVRISVALFERVKQDLASPRELRNVGLVVVAVFCVLNYLPSFDLAKNTRITTGFGMVDAMLTGGNSLSENNAAYDEKEIAFSKKVKETVGDAAVFNFPYDGSAYAYALCGLNVVNRGWFGYGDSEVDPEGALLRSSLRDIASDEDVREGLLGRGVEYVMLLDMGATSSSGLYDAACDYEAWSGVTSISDDTPGFSLLLSEGDMRLYRVECLS